MASPLNMHLIVDACVLSTLSDSLGHFCAGGSRDIFLRSLHRAMKEKIDSLPAEQQQPRTLNTPSLELC